MAFGKPQPIPASTKKFEKGTVIVKEGDHLSEFYIITQGSAGVYKNYQKFNQIELLTLKQGGCFGEIPMFLSRPSQSALVALTDVTALTVEGKSAQDFFARQPDMAVSVISQLCRKLDEANKEVDKLKGPEPTKTEESVLSASALFPKGHGSYALPLTNEKDQYLFAQNCTCPLCRAKFESMSVLSSRLRRESTDRDLRVHYAEIEPMYYDIISCPNCLYSAPSDVFPNASEKLSGLVQKELSGIISEVEIKVGKERDSFTVFAGYYLALRCVPLCFDQYQLTLGGLWQKLSRIYKDCRDENMYLLASQNALINYEHVYQNFYISEKQSQQICYILGDLEERLKEYGKAKNYFYLCKSNREGTAAMKMEADKRLDAIKEGLA